MRILYLTGQIKYHGGIEKVFSVKMNYLADKLNQDVFLLTYEQGNNPFVYPISANIHYEDLDINYDVSIHHKGMFTPHNIKKGIKHIRLLRKKIEQINPDIIITPNGGFDFMALPYITHNVKIIREMHSSLYLRKSKLNLKERIRFLMDAFFEKKYSNIVTLNKEEEEFICNDHIVTIPNPVFVPRYREPLLDSLVAVTAGRICPIKGYDNLIKAWNLVVAQIPTAVLHIYGSGEEEYIEYIKNIIYQEKMNNNVFLKGQVNTLSDILPNYSVFISSSQTECFPMVFLEAMSCGLPVISFDCPTGPSHIVSDTKDGFLVKNQNIEDLSQKIVAYFKEKDKINMSLAAYQKANNFRIEKIMKRWLDLFESNIYVN